jgi:uncharacterized integral membrane protein (TIGR00698 family)
MSHAEAGRSGAAEGRGSQWRALWQKEDWWAIWIGLLIVLASLVLFTQGASLRWVAVTPPRWSSLAQLAAHFSENWPRYIAQLTLWSVMFSVAVSLMGHKLRAFLPAFLLVYIISVAIFVAGQYERASTYGFEAPLVALIAGLVIGNLFRLPRALDAGFRVEFYIKTAIVLLGATVPFTLIVWAGPVAIVQASIVSLATFSVIYFAATRLGLDRRFAATLGAGGAVCGVSAAIAVAAAVGAKKEETSLAITLVILWAMVMIFVLPFLAHALALPAGVGGAWIGTSEFADAAGLAAAQTYGGLVSEGETGDAREVAVLAFTLMKVVGRDAWIGIWAFVLALIATTRWEGQGRKANAAEIWWRFPKFVLGFLAASLLVTSVTSGYALEDYNRIVNPGLVAPVKDLRSWAFIFSFFSIGLTTRFRELARVGARPFIAFTAGVIVNVPLGLVLSALVFASYWAALRL